MPFHSVVHGEIPSARVRARHLTDSSNFCFPFQDLPWQHKTTPAVILAYLHLVHKIVSFVFDTRNEYNNTMVEGSCNEFKTRYKAGTKQIQS